MKAQLGGNLESVRFTYDQQEIQLIVESLGPEEAPLWLLLPALSTVSSRSEWIELAHATNTKRHVVSFDWPGFGESDRPPIKYDNALLRQALLAIFKHLAERNLKKPTLLAAGHSASIALGLASECSKNWDELVLIAPTWRGPLPTMTGWHPKSFAWVRWLVSNPVIGPVLYRLNTHRAVLKAMLRRHVWVNTNQLTPERIQEQQRLSRRSGARFASASFVSGGLDPAGDRSWWIAQAKMLECPMHIVLADAAPPRSKQEMELLADYANKTTRMNGRLGLHQEFGTSLGQRLLSA